MNEDFHYGPPDTWEWVPISFLLNYASADAWDDETVGELLHRKRLDEDYPLIRDSLRDRGWVMPIHVYDRTVTDGHHRIAAAIDLGLGSVPVFEVNDCRQEHHTWLYQIDEWSDHNVRILA